MIDLSQYDFLDEQGNIIYPTFIYKDVSYVKLSDVQRVAEFQNMLNDLEDNHIKKLENKLRTLEHKLENATKREEKLKEELNEAKETISDYHRIYGSYVSPNMLITELYRGGVLEYQNLQPRKKLNIKISEKQYKYWINVFLDLGIVQKNYRGQLVAGVSKLEAYNRIMRFNPAIDSKFVSKNSI
jgi:NurA-like 5'-3' nuclease